MCLTFFMNYIVDSELKEITVPIHIVSIHKKLKKNVFHFWFSSLYEYKNDFFKFIKHQNYMVPI